MDDPREELGMIHIYSPAQERESSGITFLLLHGTGGDENDLLPLGRSLLPGAAMLSPRGGVLEQGMPRFFRRLAPGVFDLEDLRERTEELGDFLAEAARTYGFDAAKVVAVGFSNGANIGASLLLRRPGTLRAAVLLSPMVPFEPEQPPQLSGTDVFIGAGRRDVMSPPEQAERLSALLESAGANVRLHWEPGGHQITDSELEAVRDWLATLA
jgi:predicted esterase